ncbi:MAG: sigma-70 family RNA polymerase sigma factor [Planctomycetota bacterium]
MLTIEPNTRHSLLIRLSDHDDQDAWGEFLRTYEPVLYRMARRRETQDADAREIVQEVLLRVAQRIQKFDLSKDGSFRGWLNRTTRNVVIDRFRRLRLRENGVGTDTHHAMLLATPHPATTDPNSPGDEFDYEQRLECFRMAVGRVRPRISDQTWRAFVLTALQEQPAEKVAVELGISTGAVYLARCRVMKLLRETAEQLRRDDQS